MCIIILFFCFFLVLYFLGRSGLSYILGQNLTRREKKVENSQMAEPRDLELVSIIRATKVSIKHMLVSGFLLVYQITFLCPLVIKSHGLSE